MSSRSVAALAVVVLALLSVAAGKAHKLVDEWTNPDFERRPFRKIVVVAIVDDEPARKQFENKFVSHLRGRSVEAAVSYEVAPDLTVLPSRGQVAAFVEDEAIDGAISVRVVPLGDRSESDWGAAWRAALAESGTLADLVRDSLPVKTTKSPSYGVEVALWDADKRIRVWAARTDPYTLKEMRKGAGTFVQFVIDALKRDRLI